MSASKAIDLIRIRVWHVGHNNNSNTGRESLRRSSQYPDTSMVGQEFITKSSTTNSYPMSETDPPGAPQLSTTGLMARYIFTGFSCSGGLAAAAAGATAAGCRSAPGEAPCCGTAAGSFTLVLSRVRFDSWLGPAACRTPTVLRLRPPLPPLAAGGEPSAGSCCCLCGGCGCGCCCGDSCGGGIGDICCGGGFRGCCCGAGCCCCDSGGSARLPRVTEIVMAGWAASEGLAARMRVSPTWRSRACTTALQPNYRPQVANMLSESCKGLQSGSS